MTLQPSPDPFALRIALVAGEASGDQLGAGLIAELKRRFPDAEFAGIGGAQMRAVGLDAWHDCDELAVMGLAEVLAHLPRLIGLRRRLRKRLLQWRPDVFIGIDAPDFNLGLERKLKSAGIRTVHYVSPSIWAWREARAAKIARSADRVLCLFPIEPPIYARYGVAARFVGHPLADSFPFEPDRAAARMQFGLTHGSRVLALLPGSRASEIRRLLPDFLGAAVILARKIPDLQILIPAANSACRHAIDELLASGEQTIASELHLHVLDGFAHDAMVAADAVLLASGTAALEALLAKRPMVVGYRISPLTHFIVKRLGLLKVDRYSLPNVLADHRLVPELMQDDCTAEKLADALMIYFADPAAEAALLPRFRSIHESLRRDANVEAANAVVELLAETPGAALNAILHIAGVDEAGRGPLAGPVVCAAVILNPKKKIRGLADSKKLSPAQREELFLIIQRDALAWQIAFIEVEIIDRLNILHATMEGMRQAICGLPIPAQRALIDGNRIPPNLPCPADALVNGDNLDRSIMAASILAKVSRDRHMRCLDAEYPGYGFAEHKGYSTPEHLAALERLKPCLQHRRSFAPVRRLLEFALE